jgi:hypothetical protein
LMEWYSFAASDATDDLNRRVRCPARAVATPESREAATYLQPTTRDMLTS